MEPTDQPDYRRAEFITRTIAGLAACGIALYAFSGQAAAIFFALSLLVTLCHVCAVNPARLMWRLLRRAVGHRFDTRFTWGELNLHRPYFKVGLRLSEGHECSQDLLICEFIVGSIYIRMPTSLCRKFKKPNPKSDMDCDFGFYTIDNSVVWRWNCQYWSWNFPFFSFNHFSTEVLSTDGKRTVYLELASDRSRDWSARHAEKEKAQCANCEVHPYTYTRRNGEVQHRMATCYIDRMKWARKWFPFLKLVKTTIWVTFNEEIGEEVGSWKGGTTGCGWEKRPTETILQCLRRMESDRFFEKGRHHTRSQEKKSTTRGFLARLFLP